MAQQQRRDRKNAQADKRNQYRRHARRPKADRRDIATQIPIFRLDAPGREPDIGIPGRADGYAQRDHQDDDIEEPSAPDLQPGQVAIGLASHGSS